LSLAVIAASLRTRATAALFKGLSLSPMTFRVLGSTIYHTIILGLPSAELMGGVAVLALAANLASVLMLMRYKDGDANVRSVWLCSRNDAIGNVVVMIASAGVWGTGTAWPDLGVAALMAGIFSVSSAQILRQAWAEHRDGRATPRSGVSVRAHTHDHPMKLGAKRRRRNDVPVNVTHLDSRPARSSGGEFDDACGASRRRGSRVRATCPRPLAGA